MGFCDERAAVPTRGSERHEQGPACSRCDLGAVEQTLPAEPMTMPENQLFVDLLRTLSSGEATCVVLAGYRAGIGATDDRAARSSCAERGIPVTGTIGILKVLCVDRTITSEEAEAVLARMVDAGFYSPVRRVSDLL